MTILGCGTSSGVPSIAGGWGACDPGDPRNRRRRVSVLVQTADAAILIDTSPDLREQALDADIRHLDAVLYTHDHADHCHGIDDLRGIAYLTGGRIPVHGDPRTLDTLTTRFPYIFKGNRGYPALCDAVTIDGAFDVQQTRVMPFDQQHGPIRSLGYRIGSFAYSTDVNGLPEASFAALEGIDTWVVDGLRHEPHPTHAHLDLTLSWIARVRPRRAVLTHMTQDLDYETLRRWLPDGVEPGYDGMVLEVAE